MSNEILTTKEAAKYLAISDDSLRAYEKQGFIHAIRYPSLAVDRDGVPKGGKRRTHQYRKQELDRFLASCSEGQESDQNFSHNSSHKTEIEPLQVTDNKAIQKHGYKKQKGGDLFWMERHVRRS